MKLLKNYKVWLPHFLTVLAVALMLAGYHFWMHKSIANAAESNAEGAAGQKMLPYQGVLHDTDGAPVDGNVDIVFRLYDAATGGTPLWSESHTGENAVPVRNGLFQVLLGSLTPIPSEVWTHAPLYLGVQVGSDSEMAPREVVGATGWAIQAQNAEGARQLSNEAGTPVVVVNGAQVGIGTLSPVTTLDVDGEARANTFWSDKVVFTPTTLDYTYEYTLPTSGIFQVAITAKGAGAGCGQTDPGTWSIAHRVYFMSRLGGYPETVTDTAIDTLYTYNRNNGCTTSITVTGKRNGKVDIRVQNGKDKPVTVQAIMLAPSP